MATSHPSDKSADPSIVLPRQEKSIPYRECLCPNLPPTALDTCGLAHEVTRHAYCVGLLGGKTVIRQSVLRETLRLLDSADPKKRHAAQRALAMLAELHTYPLVALYIDREEPSDPHPDNDLLRWATSVGGQILTIDTELQRRAREQGIRVLTAEELHRQLQGLTWTLTQHFQPMRPIKRGDTLSVHIEKCGEKEGQGIAYLDDGRMVVIDQGAPHVGKVCTVYVQRTYMNGGSVEMIFATIAPAELD